MTNTQNTQISRQATSVPAREIHAMGLGKCEYLLHYGEGKAFLDTQLFQESADFVDVFDPYSPDPLKRIYPGYETYEKIVAIYVFNTLPPLDRRDAVEDAMRLLNTGGQLIAAVRADTILGAATWDGVMTKKWTFQKSYTYQDVCKEYSAYGKVHVVIANRSHILFTITKE